jgi:hypothetical protein
MATAIVRPDQNSPAFGSSDEAADAVSKSFGSTPDVEQAAVILQRPDGSHVYSTLVQHSHDDFQLKASFPKGWKISGIVHSHPGQDDAAKYFSQDDVNVADQLKVPSYIRFNKDASIRKYVAGRTAVQNYRPVGGGSIKGGHVSLGDPLDAPPPAAPQTDAASDAPAAVAPPAPTGGLLNQAAQATP